MKIDTRLMVDIAYTVAKTQWRWVHVAWIPSSFNAPSKGPFDPGYMGPLFQTGYEQGRSATPFSNELPPIQAGRRRNQSE